MKGTHIGPKDLVALPIGEACSNDGLCSYLADVNCGQNNEGRMEYYVSVVGCVSEQRWAIKRTKDGEQLKIIYLP